MKFMEFGPYPPTYAQYNRYYIVIDDDEVKSVSAAMSSDFGGHQAFIAPILYKGEFKPQVTPCAVSL
ncbi:MAG: hypothetical protein JXA20_20335 [Spirochaetes bacterium]|nr:hypothetical protein [Spirochaetota bacterium]